MPNTIRDGSGKGFLAHVTDQGQIKVVSENHSIQHHISKHHGESFQIIGDFASVNNSTHTILHLSNTSSTKLAVFSFIRLQTIDLSGGTTLPSSSTRFEMGFGRTRASGGTEVTPVVLNRTSGKSSGVTCYDNNPTMSGTFTEIDRWYVESDGKMMTFNKDASIILGKNSTFEIRLVSDHTSGTAYARITFFLIKI